LIGLLINDFINTTEHTAEHRIRKNPVDGISAFQTTITQLSLAAQLTEEKILVT